MHVYFVVNLGMYDYCDFMRAYCVKKGTLPSVTLGPLYEGGDKDKVESDVVLMMKNFLVRLQDKGWEDIYLVGNGMGSHLAWRVAEVMPEGRRIKMLASMSAHPDTFDLMLGGVPARQVPFYSLLDPIVGQSFLAANDFEALKSGYKNETWWTKEWEYEYQVLNDRYFYIVVDFLQKGYSCKTK